MFQNKFLKNLVSISVCKDFWYQELANQIDFLCNIINKMQFYYMTYIFTVQDRALILEHNCCIGCCHFVIWLSKRKKDECLWKIVRYCIFKFFLGTPNFCGQVQVTWIFPWLILYMIKAIGPDSFFWGWISIFPTVF